MKNTNDGVFLEEEEYKEFLENNSNLAVSDNAPMVEGSGPQISLYDLNRNMIFQLGALTKEKVQESKEILRAWLNKQEFDSHYMFLCNHQAYYTVFDCSKSSASVDGFITSFLDLLEDFAQIFDIAEDTNGAIAVWANWDDDELPDCYYLFPYGKGVVIV